MMRAIFFLFLQLFATVLCEAQSDRLSEHHRVVNYFSNLHFFHDGQGMHLSPNLDQMYRFLKEYLPVGERAFLADSKESLMTRRWGFNVVGGEVVGFYSVPYLGYSVGVLGCVACHSGFAAGIFIPGLGNKNIDPGQTGNDLIRMQQLWKLVGKVTDQSPVYQRLEQQALAFAKKIGNDDINNLTQGLVATSLIREWFYTIWGYSMPPTSKRGAVKVPHLWGYGEKRLQGQFCDGYGDGEVPGWGIAVELVGGQTPSTARKIMPKILHAEEELAHLLPPTYPFAIDQIRANQGKKIFEQHCLSCHGSYERDHQGLPKYQAPNHIPWEIVKTDRDRLLANTDEFNYLVSINPLYDFLKKTSHPPGYFAPRLEGVWARFPYLHNASVPTLYHLLLPPSERPRAFSLKGAGTKERFDEIYVGLTHQPSLEKKYLKSTERSIYQTTKVGQSNQGHYFDSFKNLSHQDRLNLMEYLKSL